MELVRNQYGQRILIHGGAGGIGSIAIQLAKNLGAHVATTVSANDKEFVQELGADQVIDYKSQNFEDLLHDYDVVFDTVGGETYRRSFKVLGKGRGIIVSMLEQPNSELMNQYGIKAIFQFTQADGERLTKLAQWVDQNNIRVNVERTFLLDEAGNCKRRSYLQYLSQLIILLVWVRLKYSVLEALLAVVMSGQSHRQTSQEPTLMQSLHLHLHEKNVIL
jgi:NADPH:quinone reductase-like Zn-dependent oxidoreductase